MHARIATFQHEDAEAVDKMVDEIRGDSDSGPPPGLEDAKGFMLLVDRQNSKSVGIIFFDSEEALKRGDEVLNKMTPDAGSRARRTSVDFYEVPIQQLS
jgi:hypothetical protein